MQFGGILAVDNVSLAVEQGTVHAIIGPNGAGKTTLFNVLSGRYRPTAGRVLHRDVDITTLTMHKRALLGIGRSFQITNIFPNLTVLENVRLAVQAQSGVNFRLVQLADRFSDLRDRALEALEMVGLVDLAALPASSLPHGGKRKLEIAIILASDPEILLLDEPTAGMASEQVPELMATIDHIRRKSEKTIVLVEHNMGVVMGVSDTITVMHLGQLLAQGTPAEISQNATVQKVYLGDLYGTIEDKEEARQ
jgi:branched-chain amino acid transport system ATP-binding protein